MRWVAMVTLVTMGSAACFSPNLGDAPFKCGAAGNECPPGYECTNNVCTSSTGGDRPDALACTNTDVVCENDVLVDCSKGPTAVSTTCPGGCDTSSSPPRCLGILISNLDDPMACSGAVADLEVGSPRTLNTDGCSANGGTVVEQADASAPPFCVFKAAHIHVSSGAKLTFTGSRIPFLLATGKVQIDGIVSVAAVGSVGGPGADADDGNARGAAAGTNTNAGGGGGAHAQAGGRGGIGADSATHVSGGTAFGNDALSPLRAGGYGGAGGNPCLSNCQQRSLGGGAGGAIEIVGCVSIGVGATGIIDAGGGGGNGGTFGVAAAALGGGDGGGAGGSVLLESPLIELTPGATIAANGGAGGAGASGSGGSGRAAGRAGADGGEGKVPAAGGEPVNGSGGKGGNGGTAGSDLAGSAPGDGDDGTAAGGGGGSAGRIRLNARADHAPALDRATISPSPSIGVIALSH